ncbi:pyridoxal-phosphate-dependent aminotransferase family protein [Nanoarchaeota archaeon]
MRNEKHTKLFIPGPTEVKPEILDEMANWIIGHRSNAFKELYADIIPKLQKLLYTEQQIFLSTSSATGIWEAAIRNCVSKKCLHVCQGAFSDKWASVTKACGKDSEIIKFEWGKAIDDDVLKEIDEKLATGEFDALAVVHNETSTGVMNDLEKISEVVKKYSEVMFLVDAVSSMSGVKIEVDKLGIDVILASVQKAFALPPGFAVCVVSQKAMEKSATAENKGYYFDFIAWKKYADKNQTAVTPSIPHLYALNKQLDRISEEGLDNRFDRHKKMKAIVLDWIKANQFELFAQRGFESITLTTVKNNKGINVGELNKKLEEKFNMTLSNGYGDLKEKTFRISHMGDYTEDDIKELLSNVDEILNE